MSNRFWSLLILFLGVISFPSRLVAQDYRAELTLIQQSIDKGNLNYAAYLLERVAQNSLPQLAPYLQAIRANLALQQGNYSEAIALYQSLYEARFGQNDNRLALLDNFQRALLERAQVYEFLAEDDRERKKELAAKAQSDRERARDLALLSAELANSGVGNREAQLRAKLNLAQLDPQPTDLEMIGREIEWLPPSPNKAELLLDLAETSSQPLSVLQHSVTTAQALNDPLILSKTWGLLARYYQREGQSQESLVASHQAALAAQEVSAWSHLAQWQWIAASAYQQLGDKEKASSAYRNAVSAVRRLRQDLAGNQVSQTLYIDTIEPLLRDFLAFLLDRPSPPPEVLAEAISLLQLNQLAELDNYFGRICQVEAETEKGQDSTTAIIYTIVLPSKSYVILQLAGRTYQLFELPLSETNLKQEILNWRRHLTDRFYGDYRPGSVALYELLVRPMEGVFKAKKIAHLVFVQDGLLKNVPMAALYDSREKHFLIEDYAISYSLGLKGKLNPTRPQAPLIVASSQASPAFPNPLPGVIEEAQQVENLLGGTQLLNHRFTPQTLTQQLQNEDYKLLHVASHGRFAGLAQETLLQTGTQTLSLEEFEGLLRSRRSSLLHLTLSACETAESSRYAVLGMAGIGLRAGIGSVLGSLWFASDSEATTLMLDFYHYWKQGDWPEDALRKAQIQQLQKTPNPFTWGSLIFVTS